MTAPKYPRPRQWTPERILCLAGKITSFYPVRSPGGYQLLGRTPVDLYDPLQRNKVFRDSPVLPIAGERHRYVPIDENAYKRSANRSSAATIATTSRRASTRSTTIWRVSMQSRQGSHDVGGGQRRPADDRAGPRTAPAISIPGCPPPAPLTASRYASPIFWSGTIRAAAIWSAVTQAMPVSRCFSSDVAYGQPRITSSPSPEAT